MKRRTAFRDGAFADVSDLNPWLLTLRHLDSLAPQPNQIGFKTNAVRHANRHLDPERGVGEAFLANTRLHTQRPEWDASAIEYFTSSMGPVIARSGSESVDASTSIGLPDPTNLHLPLGS